MSDQDVAKQKNKLPTTPEWAEKDEDDSSDRNRFMFFGTNMAKVPCFRSSFMNAIGSGMVVGLAYNLATSRNPLSKPHPAFCTYTVVLFGSWFYCRYNLRIQEAEHKKISHAMSSYHMLEGTEEGKRKDEEWAASALDKRTNIRNYRSDAEAVSNDESKR